MNEEKKENSEKVQFYIDLVGSCNLKCPSCPKGNSDHVTNSTGVISLDLLEQIIQKAKRDYCVESINLYNWTEPFVHPKLPEIIHLVHQYGIPCGISSNLNHVPRLAEVMAEKPDGFRVSLSGFNQTVYSRTHTQGNIEKVKDNLKLLASLWKENGSGTYVEVCYHRYLGNLDDEIQMHKFVDELGLVFAPTLGFFCPLEKNLNMIDPESEEKLTSQDLKMIEHLYVKPPEYFALIKEMQTTKTCTRHTNQIVLNHLGQTQLCCIVYDETKYGIGSFLDLSKDEIYKRRVNHDMCKTCVKFGSNDQTYTPEKKEQFTSKLSEMAATRLRQYYMENSEVGSMIAPKTDLKEQGELIAPEAKLKALSRIIEAKDEQIRAMEKILRERKHDADKALQAGETAELEAAKESQKTKSASRQRPIFDRLFRPEE